MAALKARVRSFKFMLNSCPEGFLPKELTVLVQRSLIEVLEQLSKLEPKEKSHSQDMQVLSGLLAETQRQNRPAKSASLENQQQIKEARICLEELHRFIFHQESRKVLPRNQAEAYRNQIRQLVLQLAVDGYSLNGRLAKQKGKIKLAIHYYDLALNLLVREQKGNNNQASIERLRAITDELKAKLDASDTTSPTAGSGEPVVSNEWNKFGENTETWKKKNVYD